VTCAPGASCYRPGIAVLGIGGLWLGAGKIVGLHPAEAAVAARWLGTPTVLPVHHHPADPAPAQLAADLTGSAIKPYRPCAWLHRSPHSGAVWMVARANSSAALAAAVGACVSPVLVTVRDRLR
jgi:hypothetical protein